DRCIAGEPSPDRWMYRTHVIQFAGVSSTVAHGGPAIPKGVRIDGHGQVRPLRTNALPLAEVQPLPADLAEGVRPALRRRPIVARAARSGLRVEDGAQRGQQGLAGLGIEVAIKPDHPEEGDRGVQPPPLPDLLVAV